EGPEPVGGRALVGSVKRSEADFSPISRAAVNGRAAARTEKTAFIAARLAMNRHCILGKYRRSMEQCSVMFPAIHAVANTDPIWLPCRHDSDVAAQATGRETVHDCNPPGKAAP